MLYLTCTTITSVDLAHYGVSHAKDWVSVYCGTIANNSYFFLSPTYFSYTRYIFHVGRPCVRPSIHSRSVRSLFVSVR